MNDLWILFLIFLIVLIALICFFSYREFHGSFSRTRLSLMVISVILIIEILSFWVLELSGCYDFATVFIIILFVAVIAFAMAQLVRFE